MVAEIGQFCVVLAFVLALTQASMPLVGASRRDAILMGFARPAAIGQCIALSLAFGCLIYVAAVSDFSVSNVVANSHSTKPMVYKITGVWGNHEGSMLLWVWILAAFGATLALFGQALPQTLHARVLAIQGMIGAGFLAFILFTSNPFARVFPAPLDGQGLNPLLQDPGLVLHPPFLYFGYVGFSVTFAFAVAALLEGKVDAVWAHWVRPWALAAWSFLTVGIALGSWWAYYELGWGGWWYWDPVENASFMPWLVGTAFLHSAIVAEKRDALKTWTVLLALLTFSLSLIGTFLVRSGILTSVHAFAVDPERGVFILALLMLTIGGSLTLFAFRAHTLKATGIFSPVSREGSILVNNLLIIVACATVFLGTFYPLFMDAATGEKISVGPPYYHLTFVPLMVPMLIIMVFGPILSWKRGHVAMAFSRLKYALVATVAVVVISAWVQWPHIISAVFGVALAAWVFFGTCADLASRIRLFQVPWTESWRRIQHLRGGAWGAIIAHMGIAVTVAGITGISSWQEERIELMKPGESIELAGYEIRLDGVGLHEGPNYSSRRADFTVTEGGRPFANLISEKRFYTVRRMETTEAGIRSGLLGDVYLTIGDSGPGGAWAVHMFHNPLAVWLWFGPAIMVLGGVCSLFDRSLRVGAPKRAKAKGKLQEPAAKPA